MGRIGRRVCSYFPPCLTRKLISCPTRIKKAYRKKALELHPDRNYGNTETATNLFAEIQSAYEILSDPQERAWYDSHREVFLGGDVKAGSDDYSYSTRMTTSDDIYKIFSKFSPRMEFSDSQSGFYGGLRETFSRLAWEEKMACQWENYEFIDYPSFGYRNDDFDETVRPFYTTWSCFSTKKSFAWKDIYRLSEAPDRRVRRMMEKENKRLREEGIRDFNDAVRSLTSFVKKRDPRYKPNPQSEAQRQETLRQSAATQATRSRAANHAKLREYIIPDWAKSEELPEDPDDSPESEVEHFHCVVCQKKFKSQQQFHAHERSKKHLKAAKKLRWEMRTEDKQLDLQTDGNGQNDAHGAHENSEEHQMPPMKSDCASNGLEIDDETSSKTSVADSQTIADNTFQSGGAAASFPDNGTGSVQQESVGAPLNTDDIFAGERSENEDVTDMLSQPLSASTLNQSSTAYPPKKLNKAKQKRTRKAAQKLDSQPAEPTCATCHSPFNTRSQLFAHIKKFDHAQPLP